MDWRAAVSGFFITLGILFAVLAVVLIGHWLSDISPWLAVGGAGLLFAVLIGAAIGLSA